MNRPAYWFIAGLTTVAIGIVAWAGAHPVSAPVELAGVAAFACLAILSEALSLDFVVGPSRRIQSSILFIPIFACALTFDPLYVCAVAAASAAATQLLGRVERVSLFLFNISQYVISFGSAALLYVSLGGAPGRTSAPSYFAFAGMAASFFVLNITLVASLLKIRGSSPFLSTVRAAIGPSGGNLLYDLLASPIAIVAGLLYAKFSAVGLFVLALPLLLVRYSYSSKVQLERVNRDLLKVLVKAIETRDPYTSGHSIRVSAIAGMIASDMGLTRRASDELETAALLHDIGKIESLYASVISKPHVLSDEEMALIRTHASQGADMLLTLSAFRDSTIRAVRHHHERYDGSGYPDGLSGASIPLSARIIMVADSIDAMLSDRPYRAALTPELVERELRECVGTQFDPGIIETMFARATLARIVEQREHVPASGRMRAIAT